MFTPYSNRFSRDRVPMGIVIDKACRVYISQIPLERLSSEGMNALRAEFESCGPVESYQVFTDKIGRFTGCALCTFRNPADAAMAMQKLNNKIVTTPMAPEDPPVAEAAEGDVSIISPHVQPLRVVPAKEHGVVLLHPSNPSRRGFLDRGNGAPDINPRLLENTNGILGEVPQQPNAGVDENGRWKHDQHESLLSGDGDDFWNAGHGGRGGGSQRRTRGRGRGGQRGGHGHDRRNAAPPRLHGSAVDDAFEKYIQERDQELGLGQVKAPETHESAPQAPAQQEHAQEQQAFTAPPQEVQAEAPPAPDAAS